MVLRRDDPIGGAFEAMDGKFGKCPSERLPGQHQSGCPVSIA